MDKKIANHLSADMAKISSKNEQIRLSIMSSQFFHISYSTQNRFVCMASERHLSKQVKKSRHV
jgi:hypothetical protein